MRLRKPWQRQQDDLEAMLRANRATPSDEFVSTVSSRLGRPRRPPRRSLAVALIATVALIAALGASGGIAYATTGLGNTLTTVTDVLHGSTNTNAKKTGATVQTAAVTSAGDQYGCGANKLSVRWHYKTTGSGSWSGTGGPDCTNGVIVLGPQAMEGDLKVNPGATIMVGYSFTMPGNTATHTVMFTMPKVVFTPRCGNNASTTTLTAPMPSQTYTVTNSDWYPSGDQKSVLTFQGSVVVPDLCSGGQVRFDKGGTFSASVLVS